MTNTKLPLQITIFWSHLSKILDRDRLFFKNALEPDWLIKGEGIVEVCRDLYISMKYA